MLAGDVTELRDQIQYQGGLAGLNPPITWNPTSINQGDWILASHFRDMRAAIQRLWDSKNRGSLPMWSSGTRPGGPSEGVAPTSILATDINDLRHWLDLYIDNHPRTGIDTKSYDASAMNRPMVDNQQPNPWIANIRAVMPPAPSHFMARCKVSAPVNCPNAPTSQSPNAPIAWSNADRDNYRDHSRISGIHPVLLFT